MSPSALFYSGVKKIATNVVRRAERFIRENPEISEAARKRLSKITEARSLLISPVEQLCVRRPEKTIRDICRGLAREGLSPEMWKEASVEDKRAMVKKAASVISRECLQPQNVRSEIEVCFDSDAKETIAENGKPYVYVDEDKLDSADITDVFAEVFHQIWDMDSVAYLDESLGSADVELFKESFNYESLNGLVVQSPITTYYQGENNVPEVFADFVGENTEYSETGMTIEEAKAKLEEIRSWIKEVNPNYSPWTPYGSNCGTCAYIVEKSINAGELVGEAGSVNIAPTDPEMEELTGFDCVYMSVSDIENVLKSRGPGSHLIIGINRNQGSGHWFNAYYDGEKIYTVDGQDGTISDWPRDYGNVSEWCAMV